MLLEEALAERLGCRERKCRGEEGRFRSVAELCWSSGKVLVAGDKGFNRGRRGRGRESRGPPAAQPATIVAKAHPHPAAVGEATGR